jgi:hypothetical protein
MGELMVEYYEAVGKLVYGVQRLDGILESLNVWLGSHVRDSMNTPVDEKYCDRASVASAHFAAHPRQDDVQGVYLHVLETVRDLEKQCGLLKVEEIEVSSFLIQLRECHFALADVVDKLGWPDIKTDVLRTQGSK